jgi:PAS domain S-box-containing protein
MTAIGPPDSSQDGDNHTAETPWNPRGSSLLEQAIYRLRYQELFDFAPDALLVTDRSGIIVEANHAAVKLLRFPKDFLIDKPLGLLLGPGPRARFYKCLANVVQFNHSHEFEAQIVGGRETAVDVAIRAASEVRAKTATVRWQFRDITLRKNAERQRAELTMRLLTAQESERRRMARELHDQLGQDLTALSLGLKSLELEIPPGTTGHERLRDLKEIVNRLGGQARDIAFELRPAALDDLGLAAAVDELVRRWSQRSGIPVGIHLAFGDNMRLPPDVESTIYRVIQEALTNIAKHARATSVSVIIERDISHLTALIEDDGRGFNPKKLAHSSGLGLLGMAERLSLVGGSLQIESSAGQGTTVRARIPSDRQLGGSWVR